MKPADCVKLEDRWDTVRGWRMYSRISDRDCVNDPSAPAEQPAVVLVHGLSMSSLYMLPIAKQLAQDFRVYIPDLPGYGSSQKPPDSLDIPTLAGILAEWLDVLQVGPAVMLGNSLGCSFIAALYERDPARVTHAVLVGPYPDPTARTYMSTVKRGFLQIFFEPPTFYPVMLIDYLAHGFKRTFQTIHHTFNDPFEQRLTRMDVPTLVVRGQHDRITSARWAAQAARLLPQGRLVTIPGGGHVVNYDAPKKLAREVRKFVNII